LRRAEQPNIALPFFAGFFAGMVLLYVNADTMIYENGFLTLENLERLKLFEINRTVFFWHVLGKRMGMVWMPIVLAATFVGIITTYVYIFGIGICGGVIMATTVMRYGINGVLLLTGGLMPHFIVYIPAFCMLMNWCYGFSVRLYNPLIDYTDTHKKYEKNRTFLWKLFYIHIVVIIGAFLESYVNPNLLKEMLNFF